MALTREQRERKIRGIYMLLVGMVNDSVEKGMAEAIKDETNPEVVKGITEVTPMVTEAINNFGEDIIEALTDYAPFRDEYILHLEAFYSHPTTRILMEMQEGFANLLTPVVTKAIEAFQEKMTKHLQELNALAILQEMNGEDLN